MTAPKWALALLRRTAPPGRAEDVLGDLEEAHRRRVRRRGRAVGGFLTGLEALDVAATLVRQRVRRRRVGDRPTGGGWELPSVSWLDFKLGFRMLVKHPGLTLVGGLAIAFAIAIGAGFFELVTQALYPSLPLDDGDRIVGVRNWDTRAGRAELRALHDFVTWREELASIEDLGAFRTRERNLITEEGRSETVEAAEISASAFRLARVPPVLGRALVEADELAGALPVAVLGRDLWQTRFGGDPDVVGRIVQLGREKTTVVGVMPEGFAFPIEHNVWVPLRLDPRDYPRREGPAVRVFGRLAPGVTLEEARAQSSAIGLRAAADFPDTHEYLRPEVLPYARSIVNLPRWYAAGLLSFNVFPLMLLALICGNVALLMFTRTATRESEIVTRNALGASRGRIIAQLFAEALVLGGVAAAVGLVAAGFVLRWAFSVFAEGQVPFWFSDTLSPSTVLYAGVLTVLGAVIAGVVPALKVTRGVEARLRQAAAGSSGLRFGGLWTAVIVVQVAVTVAFPASAFFVRRDAVQIRSFDVGFAAEEYLSARLEMDRESPGATFEADLRATSRELERCLAEEPDVAGVTFADLLPHTSHPQLRIEVADGEVAPSDSAVGHRVSVASVAVDFFDVMGAPILSGRGFHTGDLESDQRAAIVNRSFVHEVLGDRSPIGRRVRHLNPENPTAAGTPDQEPGPWFEIVGVVRDLGMTTGGDPTISGAGFYHPVEPGAAHPVHMVVHMRGDPASLASRLRTVAAEVEPTLRLERLLPLDEIHHAELREIGFSFRLVALVSLLALVLSLAGIYAVLSFTVSRRTREIGIRVALGSDARRIVAAIFRRPFAQVGIGVVAGTGLVAALVYAILGPLSAREVGLVAAYAALMMGVCLLACIVPTRCALRVQPAAALRADG